MFATCYMRSWQDFDLISLAIVPLFLFSGVFYPLSCTRAGFAPWSWSPALPRRRLLRGLDTGVIGPVLLVHACYLGLLGAIGW